MTIAEAYKEWCGTDRLVNSNKETHDSTECIEFAEYWHKKQVKNSVLADADVESVIELSPFNNVVKSLGDTKRKYTIWHDGGEWMVSLEPDAMNNCKTLAEFLKGC